MNAEHTNIVVIERAEENVKENAIAINEITSVIDGIVMIAVIGLDQIGTDVVQVALDHKI